MCVLMPRWIAVRLSFVLLLLTGCSHFSWPETTPARPNPAATTETKAKAQTASAPQESLVLDALLYLEQLNQLSETQFKQAQQQAKAAFAANNTAAHRLRLALMLGFTVSQPSPSQALTLLNQFPAEQMQQYKALASYVALLKQQLQQQMHLQTTQHQLKTQLQQAESRHEQLASKLEALKTIDTEFSTRPAITSPVVIP